MATFIRDANGALVDSSTVTIPANRNFRNSWVKDPNAPVVRVDMDRARAYFKEEAAKAAALRLRDTVMPAWLEAEFNLDDVGKANAKARQQAIQALTTSPAIDNAQSPAALQALWDATLLGPAPWDPQE